MLPLARSSETGLLVEDRSKVADDWNEGVVAETRFKPSIPTPELEHLSLEDLENVYDPAEDSFLLLDALEKSQPWLKEVIKPDRIVEVGVGSGVVSTFLATALFPEATYVSIDTNPRALDATKRTLEANKARLESFTFVQGSLLEPLNATQDMDLVVFNPPYVPAPEEEMAGGQALSSAWSGGEFGRVLIDKFLPMLPGVLAPHGVAFLVLVADNKIPQLREHAEKELGLASMMILTRKAGIEHLHILMLWRLR